MSPRTEAAFAEQIERAAALAPPVLAMLARVAVAHPAASTGHLLWLSELITATAEQMDLSSWAEHRVVDARRLALLVEAQAARVAA